jgi:membrane fusion protein (multidrug efflux system)
VTLRATFPNPEGELLPGMFVQAKLEAGRLEQALLAPQQGVTRNPKGQAVAMVVGAGNKAEQRVLEVEPASGGFWLVRSGLAAGDQLITEGLQFIQPGAEVVPQPASNVPQLKAAAPAAPADKAAR